MKKIIVLCSKVIIIVKRYQDVDPVLERDYATIGSGRLQYFMSFEVWVQYD
jgi:hypothetical protein